MKENGGGKVIFTNANIKTAYTLRTIKQTKLRVVKD